MFVMAFCKLWFLVQSVGKEVEDYDYLLNLNISPRHENGIIYSALIANGIVQLIESHMRSERRFSRLHPTRERLTRTLRI